eukprot:1138866-Pelagomonas_calceolata.AAC.8
MHGRMRCSTHECEQQRAGAARRQGASTTAGCWISTEFCGHWQAGQPARAATTAYLCELLTPNHVPHMVWLRTGRGCHGSGHTLMRLQL